MDLGLLSADAYVSWMSSFILGIKRSAGSSPARAPSTRFKSLSFREYLCIPSLSNPRCLCHPYEAPFDEALSTPLQDRLFLRLRGRGSVGPVRLQQGSFPSGTGKLNQFECSGRWTKFWSDRLLSVVKRRLTRVTGSRAKGRFTTSLFKLTGEYKCGPSSLTTLRAVINSLG